MDIDLYIDKSDAYEKYSKDWFSCSSIDILNFIGSINPQYAGDNLNIVIRVNTALFPVGHDELCYGNWKEFNAFVFNVIDEFNDSGFYGVIFFNFENNRTFKQGYPILPSFKNG